MAAIGLFVLRIAIARPVVRRVSGTRLARGLDRVRRRRGDRARRDAGLPAARDGAVRASLVVRHRRARPADPRVVVRPRLRRSRADVRCSSRSPRLVALWVDRPGARAPIDRRSCSRSTGAGFAAGAVLLVPGLAGHAAQTSPRAWSLLFDWSHLSAGSIWIGGLIGLLVLWASAARGAAHRGARRVRPALLERRVRLGQRADRVGRRRGDRPSADGRRRSGRPRTARRSS